MSLRPNRWFAGACVLLVALVAGGWLIVSWFRQAAESGGRVPTEPSKTARSVDESTSPSGSSRTFRGEIAELDTIPKGPDRQHALRAWARAALKRDPQGTWQAIMARDAINPPAAIYLAEWMAIDPDAAMGALPAYDDRLRSAGDTWTISHTARTMANEVAPKLREPIWDELLQSDRTRINRALVSGFFRSILQDDAVDAARRLREMPKEWQLRSFQSACAGELARTNPDALVSWLQELPQEQSGRGMGDLGQQVIPRGLTEYFDRTNDLPAVLRALKGINNFLCIETVKHLAGAKEAFQLSEPLAVVPFEQWRTILPDLEAEGSHQLSSLVLSAYVERESGRLVRQLDMESLHQTERRAVAQSYASIAPRAALEWSCSLPPGPATQQINDLVVGKWVGSEPVTATRAILALPPGPMRERAVTQVETVALEIPAPRIQQAIYNLLNKAVNSE